MISQAFIFTFLNHGHFFHVSFSLISCRRRNLLFPIYLFLPVKADDPSSVQLIQAYRNDSDRAATRTPLHSDSNSQEERGLFPLLKQMQRSFV